MDQTPEERRAFLLHYARVHLTEARRRRIRPACPQRGFVASLLAEAGRARIEAAAIDLSPAQADLFGGAPC